MTKTLFISAILLASFPLYAKDDAAKHLKDLKIPCELEVLNTLGKWEPPKDWIELKEKTTNPDLKVFRAQTTTAHVELELGFSKDQVRLQRTITDKDAGSAVTYDFSTAKNCVPQLTVSKKNSLENTQTFSDADLEKIKESSKTNHSTTLFYLWSPHMNLSIKGVTEIMAAAKKHNANLVVVADPSATIQEINKVVLKDQWPESFSRKLDSDELKRQNMMVHFPALLVCENGEFHPVRPGYDNPKKS